MRFNLETQRRHPCPDFAGIVPASRGVHCHPLHPRLASSLFASVWLLQPRGRLTQNRPEKFHLNPEPRHWHSCSLA
jgi:hypothetical protein